MAMTTTLLAAQMTPQESAKIAAENPLVKPWNTLSKLHLSTSSRRKITNLPCFMQ